MNKYLKQFEDFAKEKGIPVDFVELENGRLTSSMFFYFTDEPMAELPFEQILYLEKNCVISMCSRVFLIKENDECFEKLAEMFEEEYSVTVINDFKKGEIYAVIREEDEIEDMGLHFILPCYMLRLFLLAYNMAANNSDGMTVKEVFEYFKNEEVNLVPDPFKYYIYEAEHYISENKERYFIEHIKLKEFFYSSPESFIDNFKNDKSIYWKYMIYFICRHYHLSEISDDADIKVLTDNDEYTIIRVSMKEYKNVYDCSDIIFYYSYAEKNALYYTIEVNYMRNNKIYFPCCWTMDDTHMNFGSKNTREQAMEVIKNNILNN